MKMKISDLKVDEKLQQIDGGQRGVFVLVEKFPSGEDGYLSFVFDDPITNIKKKSENKNFNKTYDLAIFNEVQFANWFMVEIKKDKIIPDRKNFLILRILDQDRWDFVCDKLADVGINSASLNPCIAKDHRCPMYKFLLDEEPDFVKLTEWFSECPNTHYTFKGYEKGNLLLFKKPSKLFDEAYLKLN